MHFREKQDVCRVSCDNRLLCYILDYGACALFISYIVCRRNNISRPYLDTCMSMVVRGTWNNCWFFLRSCFLSCKSVKVRPLIPKRTVVVMTGIKCPLFRRWSNRQHLSLISLFFFSFRLCLNISHFSPTDTCFRACTACVRILDPAGSGGFEAEKEKGVTSESWAGSSCDVIVGGVSWLIESIPFMQ